MDRRNSWLPLTLVALLAGGALAPHLVPGNLPASPARTADALGAPAPAPSAPEPTVGNVGFVEQLAQLLNVDISDMALIQEASKRATGPLRSDDAEMVRCFFDLEIDGGAEFDQATREISERWPRCGEDYSAFVADSPPSQDLLKRVLAHARDLRDARVREEQHSRDEGVARAIRRAAASLRSGDQLQTRKVIEQAAAAARRRMAFLTVRRAAARYFHTVAVDRTCGGRIERELVQFVITTVPDPVDSYARWQFDPMLMTLTEAATADGYLPTRFFFPDTNAPPASMARTGEVPLHERQPGVLLLRHDERESGVETHKLLVLLLAYETATTGVHPAALAAALRIVLDWHRSDPPPCKCPCPAPQPEPVLMLAPTFSGSSESIAAVLQSESIREALKDRQIRIVSGSANAPDNYRILNRPPSVFRATVYPNKVLLDQLWNYLSTVVDPSLPESHSVAWLAESNTAYGNSFIGGLPGDRSVDHLIRFFPLHLSRIQPHDAARPQAALPARFGPLEIEDSTRYSDQLPMVSENTTRSYVELRLAHTMRSIRDARVRFVGLVATDARDKLFLAREVLREAPNVILFTTESDILYSHPDFYSSTNGMLLATPYPLDASRRLIARTEGEERRELPESTMVGVYNALIMLLNYDAEGRPTRADAPGLLRYGRSPDGSYRPDVWISIVGRDAPKPLWRVHPKLDYLVRASARHPSNLPPTPRDLETAAAIDSYTQSVWPADEKDRQEKEVEPRVSIGNNVRLVLMLSTILIVLQGVVVVYKTKDRACSVISEAAPYFIVSSLALVPVASLIAFFGWRWWKEPRLDLQVNGLMASAAGCSVPLLIFAALRSARFMKGGNGARGATAVAAASLAVMSAALIPFFRSQAAVSKLFVDRMSQWTDGTSPGPAIAAVALAIYAWPAIECVRLRRRVPFGLSEAAYLRKLIDPSGRATSLQLTCLNAPIISLAGAPAAFAAGVAVLLMVFGFDPVFRPLITVDGQSLGVYMTIGMLLIQTMTVAATTQFVCLWLRLAELLDHAAALGLDESFRQVPDKLFPTGAVPRTPRLHEMDFPVSLWKRLTAVRNRLDRDDTLSTTFKDELTRGPREVLSRTCTWVELLRCAGAAAREVREEHDSRRRIDLPVSVVPIAPAADPISLVVGRPLERFLEGEEERRASASERKDRELFAILPFVLFVRMILARMWDNLAFVGASLAFVAAGLWGYRLQMKDALVSLIWFDVVVAVLIVLYVFVRMERNELLSHITSTKPGEIAWDRDFVVKLFIYGLVPLAGLFATQFPNLSGTVIHWLEPVQKALP